MFGCVILVLALDVFGISPSGLYSISNLTVELQRFRILVLLDID